MNGLTPRDFRPGSAAIASTPATQRSHGKPLPTPTPITCDSCEACCCRLEVMLITDTGVPERFIATDQWGGQTMARLADGWCAALNRDTLLCSIYEQRPLICREFATGSAECIEERVTVRNG